jgi:polyhydroxybutyrate depolymerase
MPYGGGYPALIEGRVDPSLKTAAQATGVQTDSFVSGPETAAFWAGLNGCTGSTVTNLPDKAADGTTVTKTDYTGCASGAGTSLYTILNGGHTWPGANVTIDIGMGLDTKDISATTEMVTFFKKFGL